jgi:flagellar hook-associated protein FlgK
MAGLLGDLLSASRALAAHQTGVQVAGRNIANVNTPG